MARALAAARLIELMAEDASLQAKIGELQKKRDDLRAQVVADLQRRKDGQATAAGQLIELAQQMRRRPSVSAARTRLGDRPDLLSRIITEVVDAKELTQLLKDGLLQEADVDFIAPKHAHGGYYPVMKTAPRGRPRG